MATVKSLVLTFSTSDGKKASMTFATPKENLEAGAVKAAMNEMTRNGVFVTKTGILSTPVSAEYVERKVSEIFKN